MHLTYRTKGVAKKDKRARAYRVARCSDGSTLSRTDSSDDDHVMEKKRRISLSSTPFQSDSSSPYPSSSRSSSSIRSSPFSHTVVQRMSISPLSSVSSTLNLDLSEDEISRFEKRLEEG